MLWISRKQRVDILGAVQLRQARQKALLAKHPDKNPGSDSSAQDIKDIQQALHFSNGFGG